MSATRDPRRPPTVAVMHDLGSASATTIRAAAGRQFELVFVCDRARAHVAATIAEARRCARVIDVTGQSWDERVAAVRAVEPSGVVTFSEFALRDTARMAGALGLSGHSEAVVELLTDKLAQRSVLASAGVQATRCAIVGSDLRAAAVAVGFPAVLKPRVGAGSAHTFRIESLDDLEQRWRDVPPGVEFVLEEMLCGDPEVAGASWGDYVSVESVHAPAGSHQVCITGKFPLAEPFRESGMVLPCTLPVSVADDVLALEAAAIAAIGVAHGVTHTEIKLTASGPKIIEINGRLGGYVPEILKRSSGISLVHAALALAVGRDPSLPPTRHTDVCYQLFLAPPSGIRGTFVRTDGLAEMAALPGVIQVEERVRAGDLVDYQQGTQSLLGIVYGHAPDHEALRAIVQAIHSGVCLIGSGLTRICLIVCPTRWSELCRSAGRRMSS
jgi:biotin carboxylase